MQNEDEPLVEPDGNGGPSRCAGKVDVQLDDGNDAARSAKNVERWRLFLPKDCIDTMVRMGWDRTT
ncbi:MAG: hypothetical protein ABSC32_19480 [Steroidobacteraceae bacterium]